MLFRLFIPVHHAPPLQSCCSVTCACPYPQSPIILPPTFCITPLTQKKVSKEPPPLCSLPPPTSVFEQQRSHPSETLPSPPPPRLDDLHTPRIPTLPLHPFPFHSLPFRTVEATIPNKPLGPRRALPVARLPPPLYPRPLPPPRVLPPHHPFCTETPLFRLTDAPNRSDAHPPEGGKRRLIVFFFLITR